MAEEQLDDTVLEAKEATREDVGGEIGSFDPTKKKKKKKVRIQEDEEAEALEDATEKVENLSVADSIDSSFAGLKKKKKKKPIESDVVEEEIGDTIPETNGFAAEDDEEAEEIVLGVRFPWEGSDRDYKYEEVVQFSFALVDFM